MSRRRHLLIGLPLAVLLLGVMATMLALPDMAVVGRTVRDFDFLPHLSDAREELHVRTVVEPPDESDRLVILESHDGATLVPVFVSGPDGDAIRAARSGTPQSELLTRTVGALGGEIQGAVIDSTPGHVNVRARVIMSTPEGQHTVDASPGEGIAAALSAGKPIWATPEAIADSGVTAEDLQKLLDTAREMRREQHERPSYSL